MLVRDPTYRYSADDILDHPFVSEPVPATYLATPTVLSRNSSSQFLDTYAENAMAFNRMMLSQLTISESRTSSSSTSSENPFFSPSSLNSEISVFAIGVFSDDELQDEEEEDNTRSPKVESLYSSLRLCTPSSKLAQRRLSRRRI